MITPADKIMKKCQVGCYRLDDCNNLLAECYGFIGLQNKQLTQAIEMLESLFNEPLTTSKRAEVGQLLRELTTN